VFAITPSGQPGAWSPPALPAALSRSAERKTPSPWAGAWGLITSAVRCAVFFCLSPYSPCAVPFRSGAGKLWSGGVRSADCRHGRLNALCGFRHPRWPGAGWLVDRPRLTAAPRPGWAAADRPARCCCCCWAGPHRPSDGSQGRCTGLRPASADRTNSHALSDARSSTWPEAAGNLHWPSGDWPGLLAVHGQIAGGRLSWIWAGSLSPSQGAFLPFAPGASA